MHEGCVTVCVSGESRLRAVTRCPDPALIIDAETPEEWVNDVDNCGACDNACAEGDFCVDGQCLSECPAEQPTACGTTCADLTTVGNGDANLDAGEAITCSATYAIAQADLDACSNSRARAEADLESAKRELEACRDAKDRETGTLGDREARLRERLRQEIQDRTVEIERLKGELAVRVLDEILFASGSADNDFARWLRATFA